MGQYKRTIRTKLRARNFYTQQIKVQIACRILNDMIPLAVPVVKIFYKVAV